MKRNEKTFPWFERRDIHGFCGLGLDNLIQFIRISALCQHLLDLPMEFLVTLPRGRPEADGQLHRFRHAPGLPGDPRPSTSVTPGGRPWAP